VFLSNLSGTNFRQVGTPFSTSGVIYAGNNGGVTTGITHTVTIPATRPTGSGFRILLRSTNPPFNTSGAGASPPFTITARPTAVAGAAMVTCSNSGPVNITAGSSATNQTSVAWTSSGTGTFTNPNSLTTATYEPSAADIVAGNVTLTLTATGNSPCGNAISTKTLTINQPPTTANAGPGQTICNATITTLAANTPTSGTGSWVFAPGNTGTGGSFGDPTSPTSTFTGTAGSSYLLRWRIISPGCGTSSNNVRITFSAASVPSPSLVVSKKDVSSCGNGSDGIVKGFATGGTAPYTFNFSGGGTQQAIPNGIVISNLPPSNNYILRVQDANGCTAQQDTNLIQMPSPSIEVSTLGDVSSCGSGLGYFTIRVDTIREDGLVNAIPPYFFQLTTQAADTTGVAYVQKSVTVTFGGLSAGSYKVRMKDSAGCASNFLQNIVISTDTALRIILSGYHNPSSCTAQDGNITVQAQLGSHNSYRYAISKDNGTTFSTFQSGRIFSGLGVGTYILRARDSRGCTADLTKTLTRPESCLTATTGSTSSLNAIAKNSLRLQALPNPTRTAFTLNLQSTSKERVQIIVTDMFGKKLYQTSGSVNQQYTFGKEFTSGMYIVQVIQGKKIQTLKLIKGN
jgi:hypothetical protein